MARWARLPRSGAPVKRPLFDPAWAGPVVAVVVALWETRHSWGRLPPAGSDTMALLIRTKYGLGQLLGRGHLDGWLPAFGVGYQEFLFYGPGMTLFIGFARLCTLGFLSDAGAYKVVAVGSFCVFPLAVAWLARSMGLSPQGAGVAAILSLLVDNPFGVGLEGIYQNSLVAQQLAAALVFIVLGGALRTLVEPRRRITVFTGVAFSLLLVTHIISTVILGLLLVLAMPTVLFTDRPSGRALRELGVAALIGVGGAAFWLLPALAHRDLRGVVATWATPPLDQRLKAIWSGAYLFTPHVALVVVAAWLYGLWRLTRNRRWAVTVLCLPFAYVLLCRFLLHRYPTNDLTIEIENRGIGMAAVIATFPLAELGATLLGRLRTIGNVVLVIGAAAFALGTLGALAQVPAEMAAASPATQAASVELRDVVPPGARFAEVREFPQDQEVTGVVHPDYWLAEMSGRWALNQFNPESSSSPAGFTPEHLLDHTPAQDVNALARLGVADVVSTVPASTAYLEADPDFHPIWSDPPITILTLRAPAGQPAPASLLATSAPARARLVGAAPAHLIIAVKASKPVLASVAVACSPKWHASVNGHTVVLSDTPDGLCQVRLPAGASRLSLRFSADGWDHLGLAVSVLSVVGVVVPWVRRCRRRRRSHGGTPAVLASGGC
jgi:hypothetical protein